MSHLLLFSSSPPPHAIPHIHITHIGIHNQIKMLIRHISIPKHAHLLSLSQPKDQEELEDSTDHNSYFTKTLNPEQPFHNIFSSRKEGLLSHLARPEKQEALRKENGDSFLTKQSPHSFAEFQSELLPSPKKQNYKSQRQAYFSQQNQNQKEAKRRLLPTFSPQLTNNAYLTQEQIQPPHFQIINNGQYLQQGEDQAEDALNNKHFNSLNKNKEVYRTLEKFRSKNKSELEDSRLKSHKKYTYDPPKQNFSSPSPSPSSSSPQKQANSEKQLEKKQLKLEPLAAKRQKPYVSNPSLLEKKRNIMPEEQEQSQSPLIFNRHKARSSYLRKTSQQEKVPELKPQSEIHLSSKHPKQRKQPKEIGQLVLEVSYRTSLTRLKEICSLTHIEKYNLTMKVPEIFAYPLFSGAQSQEELFRKADEVLKHLQIPRKDISLKKYSNCVVILAGSMGVVWHYNGKVYLGGWRHQILDQGAKNGLGLEWSPKKYVYYGEFSKNKREGAGIMKTNDNQILAGLWRDNQFVRSISIDLNDSFVRAPQGFDL